MLYAHMAQTDPLMRRVSLFFGCLLSVAALGSSPSFAQDLPTPNATLRFPDSNNPLLRHSFEMLPLPQIRDPAFRSFMLSALLQTTAVHGSRYDITPVVINGLGFFCNLEPMKRIQFDAIQVTEFKPGGYARVLAKMEDTCNIRVFVRHTAECQRYVVVYNYPTQAPPFLSEGARFDASAPGAHLSIVQTSVSGASGMFFAKAAALSATVLEHADKTC
jgi:hypothetical protein